MNADIIFREIRENNFFDFGRFGISSLSRLTDLIEKGHGLFKSSKTDYSKLNFEGSIIRVPEESCPDNYFAGALATFVYHHLLLSDRTFSYETVMSDPRKVEQFEQAKQSGFRIYLYFVCTDDPSINIGRIDQRVANNEHDVPDDKVIKRYYKVFDHLLDVIHLTDRAYLFDNSNELRLFMEIEKGRLFTTRDTIPRWFIEHVYPKLDILSNE